MADGIAITAGSGTNVATDDVGGAHYQKIKVTWGADNTVNETDTASGKPMPVQMRSSTGTEVTFEPSVAHDDADSGNSFKIGAKASTSLSGLTLVANNDRTNLFAGIDGVLINRPHCNLEDVVSGNASNTDGTSTEVLAAGAANVKHHLTTVILTNMHASTVAYVELKDGATAKLTLPCPPGGSVFNFPVPIKGSAATAWNFDPSAAVTTIYCSVIGFKSKV